MLESESAAQSFLNLEMDLPSLEVCLGLSLPTPHWLLLISPVNFCMSQRKEEFCEGISHRPPTHWKQSCFPCPLGKSLKIILVIPCRYFLSKAFLMAHVRAREFSGGESSIRRAFYPSSRLLKEIRISISLCISNATLGHLKVSSYPSI